MASIPNIAKTAATYSYFQRRDDELIQTLTLKGRLLSVTQIARSWWPLSAKNARELAERRLRRLAGSGWLQLETVWTRPELAFTEPLATWQPGLGIPDLKSVSARAIARWTEPAVLTPCAIATVQAGVRFGGRGGRFPRDAEMTHDLHLSRVYLLMRAELPTRARSWVCEEEIAADRVDRAQKLPDAQVTDGRHQTAIEFAGAYSAAKLTSFHEYCAAATLAYELW